MANLALGILVLCVLSILLSIGYVAVRLNRKAAERKAQKLLAKKEEGSQ